MTQIDISNIEEVISAVSEIPMLDILDSHEIKQFARLAVLYKVKSGEKVIVEGNNDGEMKFLIEGKLEVIKEGENGERLIAKISKGRCIGEISLIDGAPYSANIVAAEDSVLVGITATSFSKLKVDNPVLALKVLTKVSMLLSQRLRQTTGRLVSYL